MTSALTLTAAMSCHMVVVIPSWCLRRRFLDLPTFRRALGATTQFVPRRRR